MLSDEYKAATTKGDEHRKEKQERSYKQAESSMFNDDNINNNIPTVFVPQGLSTTSFDRHASPYQSSSLLFKTEEQQGNKEENLIASSHDINNEKIDRTDSIFSRPLHQGQEVISDMKDCIFQCFEAHRQKVARQARRARRHRQTQQQQQQQQGHPPLYNANQYQSFYTQPPYSSSDATEQTRWRKQMPSSSHYSDIITDPTTTFTSADTFQTTYIPSRIPDYTNILQRTSLSDDIQQYQPSDVVNIQTSQMPFSSSSISSIDTVVPTDIQSSANYYQFEDKNVYEPLHMHTNAFDYIASHQTAPSTTNLIQRSSYEQRLDQLPFEYLSQQPYASFSSTDVTVPSDIQHLSSEPYQQHQQQMPAQFVPSQETLVQPSTTFQHFDGSTQIPACEYQNIEQSSIQYSHGVEQAEQQPSFNYATTTSATYTPLETPIQQPEQNQAMNYSRERYQTQEPVYHYLGVQRQTSQHSYNLNDILQQQLQQQQSFDNTTTTTSAYIPAETDFLQMEQKQASDYSSQAYSSSDYYQQQPVYVPISQVQKRFNQPTGTFEYSRESYQTQEPIYDYRSVQQRTSQYPYNLDDISHQQYQQHDAFRNISEAASEMVATKADVERKDQRLLYTSIPSSTVEYTKKAHYSQEPLFDSYTTETFIEQHEQQEKDREQLARNYFEQSGSEWYSQETKEPVQHSDGQQPITTMMKVPFRTQLVADRRLPPRTTPTYDLQNYTNENIASEILRLPPSSSLSHEEYQRHRLQQTSASNQIYDIPQQLEQESEIEPITYDAYSSLRLPLSETKEIDYQQESIGTNAAGFPPPPTRDHYVSKITQQGSGRSFVTTLPLSDQSSVYMDQQQIQTSYTSPSDRISSDNAKEDEEIFDLHKCISRCFEKYQELWNKEGQRQHGKVTRSTQKPVFDLNTTDSQRFAQYQQMIPQPTTIPSISPDEQQLMEQANTSLFVSSDHQELPQQHVGKTEVYYVDDWTQTPSLDVVTQSDIIQHQYDETPSKFHAKPYIPQLPIRHLSAHSRGQQTIEYSPPLVTQARRVMPTVHPSSPLLSYDYIKHEPQQQQPIYDHTSSLPPHLSFNDTDNQSNFYFPWQVTAQPRQYENIPFDKYKKRRQRYRAHSEPPSLKQDLITSVPSLQTLSSQIFEQQPRRVVSIPMIYQQQPQVSIPSVRLIDNGRAYETDAPIRRHIPVIDPKTGLCLVPCPLAHKYAHLPPHLRPELFCIELPPASALPPPPPPAQQPYYVRCGRIPRKSLVKKVAHKQAQG